MCDGTERAICEFVKGSMKALCSDSPVENVGSGSDYDSDLYDNDDDPSDPVYPEELESGAPLPVARCVMTLLASILALLPLI